MKCLRRIRAWWLMHKMDQYHWNTVTAAWGPCCVRKPGVPAIRFYRNALRFKKHKLGPWKSIER